MAGLQKKKTAIKPVTNQWQLLADKMKDHTTDYITVEEASAIIRAQTRDYGAVTIPSSSASGYILAEDLSADRDMPPFNRATVDGIAIRFEAFARGIKTFSIKATQAAGETPVAIESPEECIEIMTGAAIDSSADTVVRYEDISMANGTATLKDIEIANGQNIHAKGKDKLQGDIVADAGRVITPALLGLAASIGKTNLLVKKMPKIIIVTTGNELVSPETTPAPVELRRSNDITVQSVLRQHAVAADTLHLKDDHISIKNELSPCLQAYDVILLTGGVSMGKFDYVPQALNELHVKKLFHKVKQRPGKPFWFGAHEAGTLVFAFPGNPVSVFMCLHRYFIPWLKSSLGMRTNTQAYAILQQDIHFSIPLQYFIQVKLSSNKHGQLLAEPVSTNGSGDFSNLIYTDAFMELPLQQNAFRKGEAYPVWRYTN
ncbi:MAG: molybdopterin molybdotransferase MoeA [Agriterribacter sp.]